MTGAAGPGKVMNRAGLTLPRTHYDKVVVGGGLLGLACAFYLRRLLPGETLLVVEADGIPSETGASYVSPALAHRAFGDAALRRRALWAVRTLQTLEAETGLTRPSHPAFYRVGWVRLSAEPEAVQGLQTLALENFLATLPQAGRENLAALVNLAGVSWALYDHEGGYGSAEAAALSYGQAAVTAGADLLLNGRAGLSSAGLKIERLEFDRAMRREVVGDEAVTADTVIVAAGARTRAVVEEGVGRRLPVAASYMQYPRLQADARLRLEAGRVVMPVVEHWGLSLRPQGEGVLLVPPPLRPDPEGFEPEGGKLAGVPVGLRDELVEALLERLEAFPCLSWASLNLGKTVVNVRGAWDVHTPAGRPEWLEVTGTDVWALLGGREGVTLGVAAAYDLAAHLAGVNGRPWDEGALLEPGDLQ
ncbi:MAG: FAD-dependent oxidoreductase [Deinococcota bacterium]|nr:FAD-dependent oxidoreductase [Deinococcota bacterium]